MQVREAVAIALAVAGVALVFPLLPWNDVLAAWQEARWIPWIAIVTATLLIVAGLLLPRAAPPVRAGWHPTALGLGAVLCLEPLLQLCLLAFFAHFPVAEAAPLLLPELGSHGWRAWVAIFAFAIILPAASEEFFFRARLLPFLARRLGTVSAVSLSTLFFAAAHGNPIQVVVGCVVGLVLALVFIRTRNCYACIAGHALHNLFYALHGGGALIDPWLGLWSALGGVWLLAFAAGHRAEGFRPRPFALVAGIGMAAVLALLPLHRQHHLGWWADGIAHLMARHPRSVAVFRRLEHLEARGLVDADRRRLIADRTAALPEDVGEIRTWVLAAWGPERLALDDAEAAYRRLRDLAAYPHPSARVGDAALHLGSRHPEGFLAIAIEEGGWLATVLPLPERGEALRRVCYRLDRRDRLRFVSAVRQAYGVEPCLDWLLGFDPAWVGPRERYYLRRNLPGHAAALEALRRRDPERAAAWEQR